jgi:hypothetical protein
MVWLVPAFHKREVLGCFREETLLAEVKLGALFARKTDTDNWALFTAVAMASSVNWKSVCS